MIEILKTGRWRPSRRSWDEGRSPATPLRVLSGLCVLLALICLALAVAYHDKARQVACYVEAADLGLAPPGDCRRNP